MSDRQGEEREVARAVVIQAVFAGPGDVARTIEDSEGIAALEDCRASAGPCCGRENVVLVADPDAIACIGRHPVSTRALRPRTAASIPRKPGTAIRMRPPCGRR